MPSGETFCLNAAAVWAATQNAVLEARREKDRLALGGGKRGRLESLVESLKALQHSGRLRLNREQVGNESELLLDRSEQFA